MTFSERRFAASAAPLAQVHVFRFEGDEQRRRIEEQREQVYDREEEHRQAAEGRRQAAEERRLDELEEQRGRIEEQRRELLHAPCFFAIPTKEG